MATKPINRELSIFINDREVINSLGGITREITRVNNEMKNLNKNSATYDADLKNLQNDLGGLRDKQKEFKEEIAGTTIEMVSAREAFSKILTGLSTGNLQMAREGFDAIKGSIMGAVKASLVFIATPMGAAIAVFSGFILATKMIFDFNEKLIESNKLLGSLGVNAKDLAKVRSEIQATAETFDKEFGDLAEKVNSLSKTYGISMSEANAIITQGLAQGGAQNNEFLDSVGEYDEFFVKAGYSAQEFVAIINKGFDLGIYSDKLPDALKEADLALKEQTKSTRDALVNAFGASFSNDILDKVRTGEITTKQALEAIAVKAKETGLSQQQQAQLTADVFKGAGEDAGGALKILEIVGATAKQELSSAAKASLELVAANEKLNKAQASLFEIEGFSGIWDAIKTSAIDTLASIIEYIIDLKNNIQPLIDIAGVVFVTAWINLKNAVVLAFDFMNGALKIFSNSIGTIISFVSKVLQGDFLGAINSVKQGFINMGTIVSDTFSKIKNTIIDSVKAIVSNVAPVLKAIGVNVDALQKSLESLKSKNVVLKTKKEETAITKTTATTVNKEEAATQAKAREEAAQKEAAARQKAADKKKSDQDKKDKQEKDRTLALAKSQSEVAKAEMDLFLVNNKTKIDSAKQLTQVLIDEEIKRLEAIKQIQLDALQVERDNKITKAGEEGKSAEEIKNLKYAYDLEYQTAKQELEFGFTQSTDALNKTYAEEQKQIALEQLLLENELAIAEADTKAQEDSIRQSQDYKKQIDGFKKLLADKKITQEEYNRFVAAADAKDKELSRLAIIQSVQDKLQEFGKLADATVAIFGQNKASANAMAAINGGLAVTEILKTPSTFPEPFASISRGIQIAGAIATTVRSISKINEAKPPTRAKFFYGGYTGSQANLGYDEYGAVTGYVHKNEWVAPESMTQSPRYAATFSWLESERKNKLKGYFEGGSTSITSLPAPVPGMEQTNQNNELLQAVLFHLQNPKAPTLLFGYKEAQSVNDLNTETQQSKNNGIVS